MFSRTSILLATQLLCFTAVSAQCPDRQTLWARIIFLKDSSRSSPEEQLKELLRYETQIQACPYRFDSTHAYLLQRIGVTYLKQSNFLQAIQYTKQAIEIINAHRRSPNINPKRVINCYFNLKVYYDSLNAINKRNEALDSCVTLALNMKAVDVNVLYAMENRTRYFFSTGDYQRCINYATMCETVASEYGYANEKVAKWILTWKINALILLKNYTGAEVILKNKIDEFSRLKDNEYIGIMYSLLAKVLKEKGDLSNSVLYYQKAFQHDLRSGFKTDCAVALNNIGFLYFERLHQSDRALYYYWKALPYSDAAVSLVVFNNIAGIYARRGYYDSAHYYFQKAFDQINAGINETDLLKYTQKYITTNLTEYISHLVLDKADAFLKEFKETQEMKTLAEAVAIYKTADRLFERIKATQYETQSKLFWRSFVQRLYEHAIEASYLQDNIADAFYFFEKSRAVLLNDQLDEQKWSAETDIIKQSQLKRRILAKQRRLDSLSKTSPAYAALEKEVFVDRENLDKLQAVIKDKNPLYYQNFLDTNFISVKDVRRDILRDHDALVEIFTGDSAVYLLKIGKSNTNLEKIDKTRFDSLSVAFLTYLSQPGLVNANFNSFLFVSHGLYDLLFQRTELTPGRIIISQDKAYLPFEALVTNIKPLTYFLDDHAVSYTYSARYLVSQFSTSSSTKHIFMGVAPLTYSGLPSLSGSDESLQKVRENFSQSVSFTGSSATRSNFLNQFYKYKIIQLYTHATDSGAHGEPMIYFADSTLGLSDLLPEEKPVSDLIVLSACQTASGKVYSGEGVFSFNRSFAALGIPSTVSNLWQTNDQATYRLTELFYTYVAKGMPLDLALQKAKLELLHSEGTSEFQLPYYWASSILVGRTDAIAFRKTSVWKWLVLVSLAIIVLAGGWKIKARKSL